jgi:hypothetical protein
VSPAPSATPVPLARIALRQVVRPAVAARPPVFHVFEELYERARQGGARDASQAGPNGRSS